MKTIQLGNLTLPPIALGTWSWGTGINGGNAVFGNHYEESDLKPVFNEAMKHDLTLWDTAAVYGFGASETILGHFIRGSSGTILSTKFTPLFLQGKNAMYRSLNKSLLRLNADYADIYWIHNPDNVEKWTKCAIPLLQSGKIKHLGVSNHSLAQVRQADAILRAAGFRVSAVQNHYSLLYRNSEDSGILNWCREQGIPFFAYMIYEQGALTGRYSAANPFPKKTRRGNAYPPEVLSKIEGLLGTLWQVAEAHQATVAQIVLAWAIYKGTVPLIGVTKTHHVTEAAAALNITLSGEEISLIEAVAKQTGVKIPCGWEKQ
ncbi:aldo/keto reductase [Acetanaerobacterium elongatum]|uniref:Predicted oxidoreductase n=1 Tax=Acetanaerobacterium elongatum TaxID=258515 RepID=A0A1H0FC10_9FIRM|nr:aldo/keto reductase [Acetanaerobacterium elongatum]SDN92184.1 Predicted oxidoreductase [Acetanaerobacterium elongatum]